ncbi:PRD domain-containing protein [Bifidobacterium leontopitheci]|uniref:Transcription antiterminator BglG n=1 Tax=Bifidobacterium leontopitheci TaxID=2650774 RepID=A0A6I1GR62_9BIFI|nr:PRD domain-containing protein [Bifidobacterium leontopitheci]KAB7789041.1 transcription antiterminator BglG [Bifidobacterium leontopitheci]
MEILRVFNNNVVLAKDGSREVIVTGRGLGFQGKPGQKLDNAKIVRVFVPADGRDPDHVAELLSEIPPEVIRLVTDAMTKSGLGDQAESQPILVMALADHITGAIRRARRGTHTSYPLEAEVQSLYANEYSQAVRLLAQINSHLGGALPDTEAVALALHLVNAGFSNGDLSDTYKTTGVIQQMLAVIQQTYGVTLDQHSVNVGRFITHLRYLFVRIRQGKQLDKEPEPIIESIRQSYGKAMECAQLVATVASLRLGANLTEDEIAYLALHISRVVADAR